MDARTPARANLHLTAVVSLVHIVCTQRIPTQHADHRHCALAACGSLRHRPIHHQEQVARMTRSAESALAPRPAERAQVRPQRTLPRTEEAPCSRQQIRRRGTGCSSSMQLSSVQNHTSGRGVGFPLPCTVATGPGFSLYLPPGHRAVSRHRTPAVTPWPCTVQSPAPPPQAQRQPQPPRRSQPTRLPARGSPRMGRRTEFRLRSAERANSEARRTSMFNQSPRLELPSALSRRTRRLCAGRHDEAA